jgi:copper homeostasis protein
MMNKNKILEICCPTIKAAIIAEHCGADRIEFCTNLSEGGTTPAFDEILAIKKHVKIPIHVLIRVRAGNFIYSENEISEMINQIQFCKQNQIDGVVIGALNSSNCIDENAILKWINVADGMDITFHKAFDGIENKEAAITKLIDYKFNRILTSGAEGTAIQGIESLKELQKIGGNRITIMPGGSIRSSNLSELKNTLSEISEFHSAASVLKSEDYFISEINAMKFILRK